MKLNKRFLLLWQWLSRVALVSFFSGIVVVAVIFGAVGFARFVAAGGLSAAVGVFGSLLLAVAAPQ